MRLPQREIALLFLDEAGLVAAAESYTYYPTGHQWFDVWISGDIEKEIVSMVEAESAGSSGSGGGG